MLYISQIQGKNVWDAWSRPVGRCADVLVGSPEQAFPPVVALALQDHGAPESLIPAAQVSELFPSIVLSVPREELQPYSATGEELPLAQRVLDRQIVDTEGRRVVRVNDLQFARVGDQFRLTGVDVGGRGLLRRLGLERAGTRVARLFRRSLPKGVIPWEDVAPLNQDDPLRLRISRDRISRLPPADIAAILNDVDRYTGQALLTRLDDETLADALEESPAEVQVATLAQLAPERAADILEEMAPDEAADLLADLPSETSDQLLSLMEDHSAHDVQSLLTFPEDTAGGIMTTEFAWVPTGLRVAQAIDYLRRSSDARDDEAMYYIYVLDAQRRLQGIIGLRDLVLAEPNQTLEALIEEVPTANPGTPQEEVAYLVAKYNLLAVPVVEADSGRMLGIVTVDDAIDVVLPTSWKKRLPRLF